MFKIYIHLWGFKVKFGPVIYKEKLERKEPERRLETIVVTEDTANEEFTRPGKFWFRL